MLKKDFFGSIKQDVIKNAINTWDDGEGGDFEYNNMKAISGTPSTGLFLEMILLTGGEVDGGNVENNSLKAISRPVWKTPPTGLFISEMILLTWGEVDGGNVEKSRLSKLVNWKEE